MDTKSKVLIAGVCVLLALSVSATFYRTVILQDFDVTGVWLEFPTEDSSYVWFFYDNEEYELELETADERAVLAAIADEVGVAVTELEPLFMETFTEAYEEAVLMEVE